MTEDNCLKPQNKNLSKKRQNYETNKYGMDAIFIER